MNGLRVINRMNVAALDRHKEFTARQKEIKESLRKFEENELVRLVKLFVSRTITKVKLNTRENDVEDNNETLILTFADGTKASIQAASECDNAVLVIE